MMNGSNVDPLTAAIAFAARAHEGQTCRSTDAPKIVHPMEVAAIAATMTSDHEILAAAMLHDVIESCGVTEDALKGEFGDRIAKLVRAMSEEKGLDAEEGWQKRKLFSINRLRAASHDQLILTLSDKLSSLRAIRRDLATYGDALWQRFNQRSASMHCWFFSSVLESLSPLSDTDAYREYRDLMNQIFGEMEKRICR